MLLPPTLRKAIQYFVLPLVIITAGSLGVAQFFEAQTQNTIRQFLVQAYHPGTCIGQPVGGGVLRQRNTILLRKVSAGYDFTMVSGLCCVVHRYTGTVTISKSALHAYILHEENFSSSPC